MRPTGHIPLYDIYTTGPNRSSPAGIYSISPSLSIIPFVPRSYIIEYKRDARAAGGIRHLRAQWRARPLPRAVDPLSLRLSRRVASSHLDVREYSGMARVPAMR